MLLNWNPKPLNTMSRGVALALGAGILGTAVCLSGLGIAAEPTTPQAPPRPTTEELPPPALTPETLEKLKDKIEKAMKNGKPEDAKKLLAELTELMAQPVAPAAPVAPPVLPMAPAQPQLPKLTPRGGGGDFKLPTEAPRTGAADPTANKEMLKQYETQMKEFDQLIKNAKDEEAREQLGKARDEFKKGMEETIRKAETARKDLDSAMTRNRDQMMQAREQMQRQMELQRKQMQDLFRELPIQPLRIEIPQAGFDELDNIFQLRDFNLTAAPRGQVQGRFGVQVGAVPDLLIEQLDLPRDTGLVVVEVVAGSVAEKAGLKKNDVLLSFAGKDVPTDPTAFAALVNKQKAKEKLEAVVLRKGKKLTLKDIELAELPKPAMRENLGKWSQMQIQINDGDVSINAVTDGRTFIVKGTNEDGKMVPSKITIDDRSYDMLKDVPEADRPLVEQLMGRVRVGR